MRLHLLIAFIILSFNIYSQKIDRFFESIDFNGEGNDFVVYELLASENDSDSLLLPLNFPSSKKSIISTLLIISKNDTISGIKSEIVNRNGIEFINIDFDSIYSNFRLIVKFSVESFFRFSDEKISDYGNYSVKRVFQNTTFSGIKNFHSELVLPEGFNVTSITETLPKQKSEETDVPYELSKVNNRTTILMKSSNLKLGDNVMINFRFKESEKSFLLMILLLIIAALYLYSFRDLVKNNN